MGADEPRVAVTTSGNGSESLEAEARAAATAAGVPFLARRRGDSRGPLLARSDVDALIIFETNRVSLVDRDGVLGFAAGLAHLRIKQLESRAGGDRLLEVAGFMPGERVLDCTLGLAADAHVAAWAVGGRGRVIGLERSLALSLLVRHGLRRLAGTHGWMQESAPIEVRHADAAAFLCDQPAAAFDVILLDPMFEHPRKASPAFHMLRRYADHAPLTRAALEEARRVARRVVVVKGAGGSGDLERIGLTPLPGRRGARVEWATLTPASATDGADSG